MHYISRVILAAIISVPVLALAACSPSAPELPSDTSPVAVADRITGSGGQAFLRDITTYEWSDDGQRAGELLSWIPRDAGSSDEATASRAGATAHALANFLADDYDAIKQAAGRNPALIKSYAAALIPYLGAMVGEAAETYHFEPLDGLDTDMARTASVFAAIASDSQADSMFTDAANKRATVLKQGFADAVAKDPSSATSRPQHDALARAARLLGLVAAGAHSANPGAPDATAAHAKTELAYDVVSKMLHANDPHFSAEYFTPNGALKTPDQVGDAGWSLYDTQLFNFLASYPPITDAIDKFGRTYGSIAGS